MQMIGAYIRPYHSNTDEWKLVLPFFVEWSIRNLDGIRRAAVGRILQVIEQVVRDRYITVVAVILIDHFCQTFIIVIKNIRGRRATGTTCDASVLLDPGVLSHYYLCLPLEQYSLQQQPVICLILI